MENSDNPLGSLNRYSLFVLASVALSSQMFTGCKPPRESVDETESFEVVELLTIDTVITEDYLAQIESVRKVEVRSRIAGHLRTIEVDEGQQVEAGQLLFTLDATHARNALNRALTSVQSAEAELRSAMLDSANARSLRTGNIISATEFDKASNLVSQARAQLEEAETSVREAETMLTFTQIRAPFNGYVNRLLLREGSLVDEGGLLTTISQTDEMLVYFDLSEEDYLDFMMASPEERKVRGQVSLLLANGETHPSQGRIDAMEGEMDPSTGKIALRARFSNPLGLLRHGSSGRVLMPLRADDVIVVPQRSTFEVQDRFYVMVVDDNNRVRMQNFQPEYRMGHYFLVKEGLQPGDLVLLEGIQSVKEGDSIVPIVLEMSDIENEIVAATN